MQLFTFVYELWAVSTAKGFGGATYGEQVLQNTHHIVGGKRTPYFSRQALSRVLGTHHQQSCVAIVLGRTRHKVRRPYIFLYQAR